MSEPMPKPIRVLFVCTGNSARSILAEALLRDNGGSDFEVHSAGTEPKGVNPLTIRVLEEARLSTDGAPAGVDPEIGDIAYYAPWGNLALFYSDVHKTRGRVPLPPPRMECGRGSVARARFQTQSPATSRMSAVHTTSTIVLWVVFDGVAWALALKRTIA